MAKKNKPAAQAPSNDGESIAGYFRKIFAETPKLLKTRSNTKLLERWLADHPGEKKVPDSVKTSLSNIKSVFRRTDRRLPDGCPESRQGRLRGRDSLAAQGAECRGVEARIVGLCDSNEHGEPDLATRRASLKATVA
jgi:hypothetical protein